MGREIHRVPLDFDWPLNTRWKGYVNPYYRACPAEDVACFGGYTLARKRLEELVHLILISGEDARRQKCHPYFHSMTSLLYTLGKVPGPDMAELTGGLSGRPPRDPFGHDGIDSWHATKTVISAAGLDPDVWGICPICKGDGIDPAFKERYEAWEREDPPAGEGWQMWETTSEGSPISPVFASPEELARWLADNKASTFGRMTADYETWLKMIVGSGWAPSVVTSQETGIVSGVEAAAEWKKNE